MKVTPDVIGCEFVGTEAKVASSPHHGYLGLSGRVADETRNTFILVQERKRLVIVKDSALFHFSFPSGTVVEIDGKLLVGRPEDRVKKNLRRLW